MLAGRPAEGIEHIEHLSASHRAKQRLKTVVETLHGDVSIGEACDRLGVHASRFHEMRHEALAAAAERLEPRHPGRKQRRALADIGELERLKSRVAELEKELVLERTRTDVARVAPGGVRRARSRGSP
ncbi:MAG TPA: hypothetical protein VFS09_11155 [Candidatus Eisenbacteria bacterium]|nr:hypothetical protein [Candidatus Eisenbacteria bacterium]